MNLYGLLQIWAGLIKKRSERNALYAESVKKRGVRITGSSLNVVLRRLCAVEKFKQKTNNKKLRISGAFICADFTCFRV